MASPHIYYSTFPYSNYRIIYGIAPKAEEEIRTPVRHLEGEVTLLYATLWILVDRAYNLPGKLHKVRS